MDSNDVAVFLKGCAIVLGIWGAYYIGGWLLRGLGRFANWAVLPLERRLLQLLQDRATARTLGIDIDRIRARRKIDGHG